MPQGGLWVGWRTDHPLPRRKRRNLMGETMTARARLMEGMRFMAESGSGHIVNMDASVEHGGADLGFRPMELLLIGLAGCTAMDVISILRKKRQEVRGYTVAVSGVRAETDPKVFTE